MLLTSAHVSLILSSVVVVICAIGIFLAGLVVQNHTVENLHAALRPHNPISRSQARHEHSNAKLQGSFDSLTSGLHLSKETAFDWSRLAQAQFVKNHDEVCDAVIVLHELYRSRSAAPKLLIFPRTWIREQGGADPIDEELERTVTLLRKASRLYRAILVPIGPLIEGSNETDSSQYSLASAFSLIHYEQVMILPTPSLIINSQPLDSLLAFHDPSNNLTLYPPTKQVSSSNLLLITPSKHMLNTIIEKRKKTKKDDAALLKLAFPSPASLSSETDPEFHTSLYTTLEELRTHQAEPNSRFSASDFLENTAIIRLADKKLPGPQYEAPYQDIVDLRPKDEDQGFLWENLYSTYKDRRYRVCGLDPKPWPGKGH